MREVMHKRPCAAPDRCLPANRPEPLPLEDDVKFLGAVDITGVVMSRRLVQQAKAQSIAGQDTVRAGDFGASDPLDHNIRQSAEPGPASGPDRSRCRAGRISAPHRQ